MTRTAPVSDSPFGRHLRSWRRQRGLSQLELALQAEVSQRHISFIETGRSRPKRAMVHRVAEALDVPLRERNVLLEAAGLPPTYPERPLSDAALSPFRAAIERLLTGHEPYPAWVINRWWEVVDANLAGQQMWPPTAETGLTAVDLFLGPGPIREMIENFAEVAWLFLRRMRREVAQAGRDERLDALLERAEGYLEEVPVPPESETSDLVLCPRLRIGNQVIKTLSMVSRFGSTREVTLDELRVELLFPADETAEAFFRDTAKA